MARDAEAGRCWRLAYAPHIGLRSPATPLFAHSARSAGPLDQIAFIASLGFAGIEDNALKTRTPALQSEMGAALRASGLAMGCFVNNQFHWNRPIWGSRGPAARDQLDRDLESSIEAAKRVGGHNLTIVSGRDPDLPLGPQLDAMVENLSRAAPVAEREGLVLAVETVDDKGWPGMILNHIEDAERVVRAVGSPAVRICFDTGHVQAMDGDVFANLDRVWDLIAVIQIADQPGRTEPGGGALPWPDILRHVRTRGYTGLVELEHMPSTEGKAGEDLVLERLAAIDAAL